MRHTVFARPYRFAAHALLTGIAAIFVAGCDVAPQAPAMSDEPQSPSLDELSSDDTGTPPDDAGTNGFDDTGTPSDDVGTNGFDDTSTPSDDTGTNGFDIDPPGPVNAPPVAVAEAFAVDGESVLLDGAASFDPDGDDLVFSWRQVSGAPVVELDGPDDAVASFATPAITEAVTLTFKLTVSDGEFQDSIAIDVELASNVPPAAVPPTVVIHATPTTGVAPLMVEFVVEPDDGSALPLGQYLWDFGDGVTESAIATTHTFTSAGVYTVSLCATFDSLDIPEPVCASTSVEVTAEPPPPPAGGGGGGPTPEPGDANEPPQAIAGADDTTPFEGDIVTLDGSGSFDPDDSPAPLIYAWTQTSGTPVTSDPLFDAMATQPQFTAPAHTGDALADTLAFSLVVSDGQDASVPATIQVVVQPPPTVPPDERHAGMPDSWLVLYNINHPDSVTWKDWYIAQWNIPVENTLGLDVDPVAERIHRDAFDNEIFIPVHEYLNDNPDIEAKIMGILVGFGVPGTFYLDDETPALQGGGGWSVSNKLQHLDLAEIHPTGPVWNPHVMMAWIEPDPVRLTKATLTPQIYLSARIDAPSLDEAQALTQRALAITTGTTAVTSSHKIYYDYTDVGSPAGDTWILLDYAVHSIVLTDPVADYPWTPFESDGASEEPTPDCAFRFSYYRLAGWQSADWGGAPTGPRVLGYAMNSWGATTLRSTTAHNGRYVPNALYNGGFAAAVGATAEPYVTTAPYPGTIVWCLRDGRTVGEAFFHASPRLDWMWEVVGDPLMTIPQWFTP